MTTEYRVKYGHQLVLNISTHSVDFRVIDNESESLCIKGNMKWDGCVNWTQVQDHFCEVKDLMKHCKIIEWVYSEARKIHLSLDKTRESYIDEWRSSIDDDL